MPCGGIWLPILAIGLTLASAVINEARAFRFLKRPSMFRNVHKGQRIVLDCRTTDPLSTSTLYFRNRPVVTSPTSSISKNASIYIIQSLQIKETGNYRCDALSSGGQKISWLTILLYAVVSNITLQVNPFNSIKMQGDSFNITCAVTFSKAPTNLIKMKWQRQVGNTFTDISSNRVLRTNINKQLNLVLMFDNAPPIPKTRYRCSVGVGKDDEEIQDAFVTVLAPEASKIIAFPTTKEIVLKESQDSIIKCTARGIPFPNIRWLKDGKELSGLCQLDCPSNYKGYKMITCNYQNDDYVNSHHCLKILSATYQEDEGTYTCVADNSFGPSDNRSVLAVFHAAPQIDKNQISTIIAPHNTAKMLSCGLVRGYPHPVFSWSLQIMLCGSNDRCIPNDRNWIAVPSSHIQQPASNIPSVASNLTIPSSADSAFYKCTAMNAIGQDSKIFKFQRSRSDPPSVVVRTTKRINAEETLTARCIISKGRFIDWLKNGVKLPVFGNPRISIVTSLKKNPGLETSTLTIANTTTRDTGLYTCVAKTLVRNTVFNSSRAVIVKAVYPPNITGLPNVTTYDYFNNVTHAQLTCHVDANPMATITWYKSGFELTGLTEQDSCRNKVRGYYVMRTASGSRDTLLICDVMHEQHTDWYACAAKNKKGQDQKTAYLDVLTPPRIQSDASYEMLSIPLGEPINMTCSATGNPHPVVEWRKMATNGSTLLWRSSSGATTARLEIHALERGSMGNYTCVASNSLGTASMQLDVRELLAPLHRRHTDPLITIVVASVGGAVGLILLLLLLVYCHVHRRNRRLIEEYKALRYLRKGEDYKIDPDRSLLEQCEDLPYDADWEFPEERLVFHGVIGSGTFGQVMKADAVGILSFVPRDKTSDAFRRRSRLRRRLSSSRMYQDSDGSQYHKTTVAVKTLKAEATESDYKDLATELKIMIHLGEHNNIINLLGACTRGKQLMVVMEYAPHGNLLNFLRSHREIYEATWRKTANNPDAEFTLADLVMYSYQIARGMDFLSSKKCVHRDLAARNILVGEDYVMKIADFGLARDIKNTDVYVKQTTGLLPVKWMAPESLFDREYTEKTDVWSFGVILWEAQTLGGTPYPGIPVEELMDYISEGKRMRQPRDCPAEIYAIMRDCWLQKPSERPTFSELVRRIERILEKKIAGEETDNAYISVFMDEDLHRIYYLEPTDTFSEASGTSGSARLMSTQSSMTEEEIARSPLPPIPCPSLEDIHELSEEPANKYYELTQDHVDNYCEPCDNVRHPDSTQRTPNGTIKTNYNTNYDFHRNDRRRESEGSTGVESGIGLEDSILGSEKENSIDRKKPTDNHIYVREKRSKNPFVAERVALLNSMLFKDKTRETML